MTIADLQSTSGGIITYLEPGAGGQPVAKVVTPGQSTGGLPWAVQALAATAWTPEVVAAFQAADSAGPDLADSAAGVTAWGMAAIAARELVITGPVSPGEIASWPTKLEAARAVVAASATADQTAMIAAEASVAGEANSAVALMVIDRAEAYMPASGKIAGLRRQFLTAVGNASSVADLEAARSVLDAGLASMAGGA